MGFRSWDVERGVCPHTRDGDDACRAKHSSDRICRLAWAELGRTPQAADELDDESFAMASCTYLEYVNKDGIYRL